MSCKNCKANKVCDHSKYTFENCNNYIPDKADFVQVVRCENCEYWDEIEKECQNDYIVSDNEGGASFSINFYLDDFCSYGTPKERGGRSE